MLAPRLLEAPVANRTRIFLASSSELKAERSSFELRINRKNKQWHDDGVFLHLELWEDFIDAISPTRSQDEYNAAICQSDIFVLLVNTKVGKYSREEFDKALARFDATKRPRIYTYFKRQAAGTVPGPEYATVRALLQRLDQVGYFPTHYEHCAEMLDHFNQQLDKLRDDGTITAAAMPVSRDQGATHYNATVSGPGASAQGKGAQAAGSGAVVIGGNSSAPVHAGTHIQTQGGAYFAGSVKAGRDVIGRDKIDHAAASAEGPDLAARLQSLQAELEHLAGRLAKPLVADHVQALQSELGKPKDKRDEGLMTRLLDGLVDLVPAGVSAVVGAFASPVLAAAAGPATAALLAGWTKAAP